MPKNTSFILGDHFDAFLRNQIDAGRYANATEVIRAGLRLLEEQELRIDAIRSALVDGAESGDAGRLDFAAIRREARRRSKKPRGA
ncbi:MAG: type II toxin-antitoxin system ParD family antitoxin [Planctomycetota bacterium]|nr:type II toxin-antitoxin system ParD family antitoxin [Planctomycetota bacterium]